MREGRVGEVGVALEVDVEVDVWTGAGVAEPSMVTAREVKSREESVGGGQQGGSGSQQAVKVRHRRPIQNRSSTVAEAEPTSALSSIPPRTGAVRSGSTQR